LINRVSRVFFIVFLWTAVAFAHDVYLPIIVDTDGAADDIRAIAMLLNSGSVDIRLIATSDGVLSPKQAHQSIQHLLACLNQSGIPIIDGNERSVAPPPFRELNESLKWPECVVRPTEGDTSGVSASAAIISAIQQTDNDLLYLCLGPMTNLASALKTAPLIKDKINRVVYLGGAPGSIEPGWNTLRDPESAQTVYSSGVPVYGLSQPEDRYLSFDDTLYADICDTDSPTARLLAQIHDFPAMRQKISVGHTKVWDEMAIVFINMISAFEFEKIPGYDRVFQLSVFDTPAVYSAYLRLIGNSADFHLDARKSVVLRDFPMQAEMMRADVAPFVQDIIRSHGAEEWKACLLTNELHRHLGIYSLVGAKMGIRAREILDAPFDSLAVVSYAGLTPPLSCLNDGLQVSTGASLGRGTIQVIEDARKPGAEFVKGDIRLKLTLKPEYIARIKADIAAAIDRFGGLGPDYFAHIRTISIQYWKDFDRNYLFEEEFSRNSGSL
jgi:pyrimidine-specific ribonucleoside hydrolase